MFEAAGGGLFLTVFGQRLSVSRVRVWRRVRIATGAAMALVLVNFALEAPRLAGEFSGLWDRQLQQLAWHTALGTALSLRLIGLAVVFAGLQLSWRPHGGGTRRRLLSGLLCIAGLAVLVSAFTSVGHTVDHADRAWLALVLVAHLACIAFWFGALWPLRAAVTLEEPVAAAALLEQFSQLAVWIVPGLLAAGVTLSVLLLPGFAVFGQPYGRLLLLKMGGFCVLMVFAGLNKLRLVPALRKRDPGAVRRLRHSLLLEYLVIAAVFAVTATLTSLYSPDAGTN
ncbi:MAG TPA: CopD family protein [Steroidobacteraceae bacterium]|jgi:putative copper resistance protein D